MTMAKTAKLMPSINMTRAHMKCLSTPAVPGSRTPLPGSAVS